MLDPCARQVYLEQLMPPEGCSLDLALACTYSLDLITLLLAPLAMSFCDVDGKEAALAQPLVVAEAVRRAADKVMVFCHRGRITVPQSSTTLYSYLEPIVIQSRSRRGASFHPKVWLLRFSHSSGQALYRLICLSRNMTFDRSWDVSVCLEGEVNHGRVRGYSGNRPLRDFVRSLPGFAADEVPERVHENIRLMADEVGRVPEWEIPDGFDELEFCPSGIPGYPGLSMPEKPTRVFAMSPFLTEQTVTSLCSAGRGNVLVSTLDALDGLSPGAFSALAATTDVYTLSDWSQGESEDSQSACGLHAKAYLVENGGSVELMAGSANATHRAFSGANVEFMVKLYGRRYKAGIAKIIGTREQPTQFATLLQPYLRSETRDADTKRKELEAVLEAVREALVNSDMWITVTADEDGSFRMRVESASSFELPADVRCACRPVTVHPSRLADARPLVSLGSVEFGGLDAASLTSFMAFELSLSACEVQSAIGFVLNLETEGMPEDRHAAVLRGLIRDEDSFISYVKMLLSDGLDAPATVGEGFQIATGWGTDAAMSSWRDSSLLEPLVRAYSREPEKIEHIERLLDDLKCSAGEDDVVPPAFTAVWATLKEADSAKETRS